MTSQGASKEAELKDLRSQIFSFFQNTRSCVFALDSNWRFIFVNEQAATEIAQGRELIGTSLWDSFPEALGSPFEHFYRRAMAVRSWESFEAHFAPLNAWYEVEAAPIDEGLIVTFRNINDRKLSEQKLREAEERYRLAARATNDLIWDWDLRSGQVTWNDALKTRAGYRTRHLGTTAKWWKDRLHPEDRDRVTNEIDAAIEGRKDFHCNYRFRKHDGSFADIEDRGYVLRDAQGSPTRFVGAMQDLTEQRRATADLREREQRLATIFGQALVGMYLRDLVTDDLIVNERFCRLLGRSADELRDLGAAAITHPDDWEWNERVWETHRQSGRPFQIEKRYLRPDGTAVWCNVSVSFVKDDDGKAVAAIVVADDISDRKRAEDELRASRDLLQTVVDSVADLIFIKDLSGRFMLTNRALDEGCGALTGKRTTDTFAPELTVGYEGVDQSVISTGKPLSVDEVIPIKGEPRIFQTIKVPWIRDGEIAGVIGVSRDLTERLRAEEQATWRARHDILTGLPNRAVMHEEFGLAINRAAASSSRLALLQLDLDHFKRVNDTSGHDAGDVVLKRMAERLTALLQEGDFVGRIGGDEFAMILQNVADTDAAVARGQAILAKLREPFAHHGQILDCRASVGVCLYPDHGLSSEQLLKAGDMALYHSKRAGRGTVTCFNEELRSAFEQRTTMLSRARGAIAGNRIMPHYQPKVDLRSGKLAGCEALLRWTDADKLVRLPAEIAAAFDELTVAAELGERMLELVLEDMRSWLSAGIDFGHVAINASAAEFRRDDFAERVLERLRASDIPPQRLQIEVVETLFLGRGSENVDRALGMLAGEGVRIALDDFGTGYASLRHLKQFPVHTLKIDQSFVKELGRATHDTAIVRAMISLGQELGLDIVAEGVESDVQAEHLLKLGCHFAQGFLYSQAVPASRIPSLFRDAE